MAQPTAPAVADIDAGTITRTVQVRAEIESGFDRMSAQRRADEMRDNVAGWTAVLDSFVRHVEGQAPAAR